LHLGVQSLGYSVAEIIKASGKKVYKTQIINDRNSYLQIDWLGKIETDKRQNLQV
jgi:hypothetical protein